MESGEIGSDAIPRKMVLTAADVQAIATELRGIMIGAPVPVPVAVPVAVHVCPFKPEEIEAVRDFVQIYKETRSTILKLGIGAFFFLMLVLVIVGVKGGYIIPGAK
jgi:hypothetical protein